MHTTSEKQQWLKTLQNKDPSNVQTVTTLTPPALLQPLPGSVSINVQVDPGLLYTVYNSHAEKKVSATLNGRSLFLSFKWMLGALNTIKNKV